MSAQRLLFDYNIMYRLKMSELMQREEMITSSKPIYDKGEIRSMSWHPAFLFFNNCS